MVVEGEQASADERDDPAQAAARAALDLMLDPSLKPRARAKGLAALTGLDARELYDRLRQARE